MYEYRARVVRVVDGDTLDVVFDLGFGIMFGNDAAPVRIRLAGIDTPETYGVKKDSDEYKAGMLSKARLMELLAITRNSVVILTEKDKTGKFGRYLAYVYPDPACKAVWPDGDTNLSVNKILLDEGHATEYK